MALAFCLFSVVCFAAFYLLIEYSQRRGTDPFGLNVGTFFAGLLLAGGSAYSADWKMLPSAVLWIGSLIGVAAGIGMLGITKAVRSGLPVSAVNTAVSLSLIIPIALSIVLYGETFSLREGAGLMLACGSIYLLQRD